MDKCSKHPKYLAIRRPKADCKDCWDIYNDKRMEKARGIAAQAWTFPETQDKVMDTTLAEAFAVILLRYI